MPHPIHISLGKFEQATRASGATKAKLVRHQRLASQLPSSGGGDFYVPVVSAFRRGLLAGDVPGELRKLLRACTSAQAAHFESVADGLLTLADEHRVVGVVRAPRQPWLYQDLSVTVSGLLGVRLANGEVQAWRLHNVVEPLSRDDAGITLHVVNAMLDTYASPMTGLVVDVRRGVVHAVRDVDERDRLRGQTEAAAEEYQTLWHAAA
jgi:hypothetical protein